MATKEANKDNLEMKENISTVEDATATTRLVTK